MSSQNTTQHKFVRVPVFFATDLTILGVTLFLRLEHVVGNLSIIIFGRLVTILTALAVSELTTNEQVKHYGKEVFTGHDKVDHILFVDAFDENKV